VSPLMKKKRETFSNHWPFAATGKKRGERTNSVNRTKGRKGSSFFSCPVSGRGGGGKRGKGEKGKVA